MTTRILPSATVIDFTTRPPHDTACHPRQMSPRDMANPNSQVFFKGMPHEMPSSLDRRCPDFWHTRFVYRL